MAVSTGQLICRKEKSQRFLSLLWLDRWYRHRPGLPYCYSPEGPPQCSAKRQAPSESDVHVINRQEGVTGLHYDVSSSFARMDLQILRGWRVARFRWFTFLSAYGQIMFLLTGHSDDTKMLHTGRGALAYSPRLSLSFKLARSLS